MSEDRRSLLPRSLVARLLVVGTVVVVLVAGVAGFLFLRSARGPLDAANGYFGDLRAGDYAGAYDRLCRPTHDAVERDAFVAIMRPRWAVLSASTTSPRTRGSTWTATAPRSTSP